GKAWRRFPTILLCRTRASRWLCSSGRRKRPRHRCPLHRARRRSGLSGERVMERRLVLGTVLGTVLVSVVWAGSSGKPSLLKRLTGRAKPAATVNPIEWQPNLKDAHRVSLETGRPLLILITGPGCAPCRKLKAETLSDPLLSTFINRTFVPVQLDCVNDKREV